MSDKPTPPTQTPAPTAPSPEPKSGDEEGGYWRRQAEKAQAEVDKLKKSQMSELERAQHDATTAKAEAEQAKAEARQARQQSRFESAAAKAGCLDSEAAFKLADLSTVGENGEGVDKVVEKLKQARPWLFKQQTGVGSPGGVNGAPPASKNQAMNDAIRRKWRS